MHIHFCIQYCGARRLWICNTWHSFPKLHDLWMWWAHYAPHLPSVIHIVGDCTVDFSSFCISCVTRACYLYVTTVRCSLVVSGRRWTPKTVKIVQFWEDSMAFCNKATRGRLLFLWHLAKMGRQNAQDLIFPLRLWKTYLPKTSGPNCLWFFSLHANVSQPRATPGKP